MSANFSISDYHDVDKIYSQIKTLMAQPPAHMPKEVLDGYVKRIEQACPKSKVMTTEAQQYIPGGVQHNLAFNFPFPIVINKAKGPYLYDIDGNRYIDFIQAGGPTVLGSNPPIVREKCIELLNTCGPSTGLFHEYELKIAKLICDSIPSVDMFRMLNSGSESVIAAVRTARVITGIRRRYIPMISGS
jgi:glutamate-1-semialdehyde 2,1-aminomutase